MALSKDRETPRYGLEAVIDRMNIPVKGSTRIYRGAAVGISLAGYLVAMSADLTITPVGVADQSVNNTAGADGALKCEVIRGSFGMANSAGDDLITLADVQRGCYFVDDTTVARTDANGTRPYAGRVTRIEGGLVYVEIGTSEDPRVVDLLLEANANLAAAQFLFMEMDTNGDVGTANAAGEHCVGVLQNAPASGAIAIVRAHGPSRVIGSAAVNPGALVATTSAGKSKAAVAATVNTSDGGAASDPVIASFVMGYALTLGASDTQHSIFVHPMGAIPTTAA